MRNFLRSPQGLIGLVLIAVFWPLNWLLPDFRTAYLFFPLWLGYILTMDGLVLSRKGNSLLTRAPGDFLLLFAISAPAWWIFELINRRTRNWEYLGGEHFSGLEYFALSTISFSTVMPAVFETAEWLATFRATQAFANGPKWRPTPGLLRGLFVAGWLFLGCTLAWPRWFYPWVWGALVLILEPINIWLGRPNFFRYFARGDWRSFVLLALGSLCCGFFWELWNFYSYPKWIYHTPGAEFWHVFEMPLLGYLGYVPFAWELFELRNLLWPGEAKWAL